MAAGLDLVARKSLEGGGEASILISSSSFLACHQRIEENSSRQDFWSWKHLKDQFCIKNAEPLFDKYQCRLQHTLFMAALLINFMCGVSSVLIRCYTSKAPRWDVDMSIKSAAASWSLVMYIIAYREKWFHSPRARLVASITAAIVTVTEDSGSSIVKMACGSSSDEPTTTTTTSVVGYRFSPYVLLVVSAFLSYPRWSQVAVATTVAAGLELTLSILDHYKSGSILWSQVMSDILCNFSVGLMGLYIRFLMEFRNRKAFLDRRQRFENKFYLQYEKEQEERLLLSVLPKHISVQVREGIREVIRRLDQAPVPQRPFTELFVEKHRNVSILYADIVNFVALTASLNVSELVETLNELFGRFDDSAERNCCLRIKLLGDCYYCVSGVPDRDPLHADHCVQMGLDMIDTIRAFREESHVNVDMRIGVHSGNVLSGLLGLRKWQFDIWSRDVTIASRMEQSGQPGCVHVSRATKDLLQCRYNIEPANGNIRDECLDMETFFVKPARKLPVKRDSMYLSVEKVTSCMHRPSAGRTIRRHSVAAEVLTSRRRTVLGFSLLQFRLMLTQVNEFMESAIDSMALTNKDQWLRSEGIQPFLLTFRDLTLERPFITQRDPLFRYSLIGVLFTTSVLTAVGAVSKPRPSYFVATHVFAFLVGILSLLCFWVSFIWVKLKLVEPHLANIFHVVTGNVYVRIGIFLMTSTLLGLIAIMGMENCSSITIGQMHQQHNMLSGKNVTAPLEDYIACQNPTYFLWCAVLTMTTVSVFLRIHFLLKTMVSCGIVAVYCSVMSTNPGLFGISQNWDGPSGAIEHYWCLGITWLLLHLLDRQVEYVGRLDYLWKRKLKLEQEEGSFMGLVNKTLLRNILPEHVAKYYLTKESMHLDLDLYHEEYTSVAVMFASIPNYMDFYSESMFNDEGRKCLQVLHEIICGFDKLMYEPQFLKLEKIKTIGSTYMVASGLQPGRNSSRTSCESSEPKEDLVQNVMVLTKFAVAMNETLSEINGNSSHHFKLRIGIAVGPVLAGVVGASKPQYDIWGDTVNIASRMDSTGITGQIQVTEAVADVLKESNKFDVKCRGRTFIKGKGWMTTYLVSQSEATRL